MKALHRIQEKIQQLAPEEREELRRWMVEEPGVAYGTTPAMPNTFSNVAPPLRTDADGAIRVGDTRVLLEVVIRAYWQGSTPEAIVAGFPTLKLADVYAVISYYLSHRDEIDAHIRQVESAGEDIRRKLEALRSHTPLTREMLQDRLKDK